MRQRRSAVVAGGVLLVAALAACSGGSSTPGTSTGAGGTAGGTSPTSAAAENFSGTTLNIEATWSGAEQANFQAVLDKFASDTGAKINYTSFGDNGATVIGTQVEGGNPPDIAVVGQPALLTQLATAGTIKPLGADTLAAVQKNYSKDWADLATVNGQVYGVFFKAANKSTVWYNKDLYDQAGATVPTTWDDFLKQLQTISDSGYSGISIGADVGWPITDWFENVYLQTAGAAKYDQLTKHQIPWTDQSVTDALTVLKQLFGNAQLVEPGAVQRTFPESVTEVFGATPKAATVYEGDFVATNIADDGHSTVGKNALFYPFPLVNGAQPAVVGGGDCAVAFNTNPATQALMTYLASPESASVWVPKGGLTSPNKSVDLSLYPDDVSRQIAQALTQASTFRFDMSDLAPTAFGGTQGQGEWQDMITFLQNPNDIAGVEQKLEADAKSAYGS
ncbi:MAG TPA: extracellular solute-binding protein [Cellulomonas sp.]